MPTIIFSVRPNVFIRAPGDNDIYLRTFANRSEVSELIRLVPDEDIILDEAFVDPDTFGNHRLTFGDEFNITLNAAFTDPDSFGPLTELAVAPPDAVILLNAAFADADTFGPLTELTVAPADGIIRLAAAFADADSFPAGTYLAPDTGGEDDYDDIAGYVPAGYVPN